MKLFGTKFELCTMSIIILMVVQSSIHRYRCQSWMCRGWTCLLWVQWGQMSATGKLRTNVSNSKTVWELMSCIFNLRTNVSNSKTVWGLMSCIIFFRRTNVCQKKFEDKCLGLLMSGITLGKKIDFFWCSHVNFCLG